MFGPRSGCGLGRANETGGALIEAVVGRQPWGSRGAGVERQVGDRYILAEDSPAPRASGISPAVLASAVNRDVSQSKVSRASQDQQGSLSQGKNYRK
jgi:hypothetical protein